MALNNLTQQGRDYFSSDPQAAFFGKIAQFGNTRMQDYWRGQSSNVYNRFVGSQGKDIYSGRGSDNLRYNYFSDYLEDFDFLEGWSRRSPAGRGEFPSRFAPRVRWNA